MSRKGRARVVSAAEVRRWMGLEPDDVERNTCRACGETIRMMAAKGTGYCSAACRSAS